MKGESAHQQNDAPAQKGKKSKHFLAQNVNSEFSLSLEPASTHRNIMFFQDALLLATSIGETQEKISLTKAEKHQKPEVSRHDPPPIFIYES